jgi:hypothetical protein
MCITIVDGLLYIKLNHSTYCMNIKECMLWCFNATLNIDIFITEVIANAYKNCDAL